MRGLLVIRVLTAVFSSRTYGMDYEDDTVQLLSSFNTEQGGYTNSAGLSLVQLSRSQIVPLSDGNEDSATRADNSCQVVPADNGTAQENVSSSNHDNASSSQNNTTVASLDKAAEARRKLQKHIKMCTTGVGLVAFVSFQVLVRFLRAGVLDQGKFGNVEYYAAAQVPFLIYTGLGIVPNDVVTIRVIIFIVGISTGLLAIYWGNHAYQSWFNDRRVPYNFDSDEVLPACAANLPETGCVLEVGAVLVWTVILAISCLPFLFSLRKIKGATVWDSSQQKGFRFGDSAFKFPARQALDRCWFSGRICFVGLGVSMFAYALAAHSAGDDAPYFTEEILKGALVKGIVYTTCGIVPSKTRRGYVMAILTAMSAETDAMSAASVAALLGKCDPAKSLELAKEKFCAINFSKLTADHFKSSRESVGQENNLYNETEPVALGSCDAFLSHSWSEDGEEKYTALETWANEFRAKNGRWPNIWLDKACINQKQIESDLLCLPIFLAGCKTLLIIAGPTYTTRVWCVLEVFVFLTMGGSIQRIKLLPIKVQTEQEAKEMFQSADITKAECYLEADKQRILGIVEQGFGNFETFNQLIRHVFHERMEVTRIISSKSSWTSLPKSMKSKKIKFSSKRISERTPSSREINPEIPEKASTENSSTLDQNTDTDEQASSPTPSCRNTDSNKKNNDPQSRYKVQSSTVVPLQ